MSALAIPDGAYSSQKRGFETHICAGVCVEAPEHAPTFDRKPHAATVRELSRLKPWRTLVALGTDWAILLATSAFALWVDNAFLWPFAWLVIATRQHALLTILHEAAHIRIVRSRFWNDAVADLFCAWPSFVTTAAYRDSHLRHHRFTNTPQDPDLALKLQRDGVDTWLRPRSSMSFFAGLGALLFGVGVASMLGKLLRYGVRRGADRAAHDLPRWPVGRGIYYGLAVGVIAGVDGWFGVAMCWIVPMFTFLPVLMHVRATAEHFGLPWDHELNQSRSVTASGLQRFLFSPHAVGLHGEHHLFPSVPWYNLARLRTALLADPEFAHRAPEADGYLWGHHSVTKALAKTAPEAAWAHSR